VVDPTPDTVGSAPLNGARASKLALPDSPASPAQILPLILHTVSFRQWQTALTPGSEPGVYRSTTDILEGGFCGLAEGSDPNRQAGLVA
jgi:hypothetical protein